MAKVLGRAKIKVDGALLLSHQGAQLALGGVNRVTRVGNTVHGFSEQMTQSRLECRVSLTGRTQLTQIQRADDVTVTFECDTGQTYVLRSAWLAEQPTVTDGPDSAVQLIFEGPPAEEMV